MEKLRPWRAPLSFAGVGDSIGFYVNHSPLTNHGPRDEKHCPIQLRIVCSLGSNSRASSPGLRPAR